MSENDSSDSMQMRTMPREDSGLTTLHNAAGEGNTKKVKQIIEAKQLDVNVQDDEGNTPLYHAVDRGHLDTARCLLELGASVDIMNHRGEGPLHTASREERAELMNMLVQRSKDVNCRNASGETAMHIAANKGNDKIANFLLESGADVNEGDEQNNDTPLHIALRSAESKGHWKTVNLLLKVGAKIDVKNNDGNTPLHLFAHKSAVEADQVKSFVKKNEHMLEQQNADGDTPLHIAARGGHFKTIQIFLLHGASTDIPNNDGNTPVHLSAATNFAVSGSHLANHDKKVLLMKNKDGNLPFQVAVKNNHLKMVKMFLQLYEKDSTAWQMFKDKSDFDLKNPFDVALENNFHSVVLEMAKSKLWKDFFYNDSINDGLKTSPLRKAIVEMPDVARIVLDQCVEESDGGEIVKLNFELVDDTLCASNKSIDDEKSLDSVVKTNPSDPSDASILIEKPGFKKDPSVVKQNHPMIMIARTENKELLDHPLVKSLLQKKWGVAMVVYYTFLVYYTLFLTLTTVFMAKSTPPFSNETCFDAYGKRVAENTIVSETDGQAYCICDNVKERTQLIDNLTYCIYVLAGVGIVSEVIQLVLCKLKNYIELHNLLDWFSYIAPILVVTPLSDCGQVASWQWQLGVAGLFVAYMNMLFFLRIIPMIGIYVMMIAMMLKNFLRFLSIMFLFVLAFSMCFYLLVQNQVAFSSPFFSIMKNCVMMIGEMDFGDIFHSHWEDDSSGAQLYFEALTWLLYIFFLVFMSLIVMNLLTSLAVIGVESLQEDSHYKILALQIELALDVEFAMPMWIRNKVCSDVRSQELHVHAHTCHGVAHSLKQSMYGELCPEDITQGALAVLDRKGDMTGGGADVANIHTTKKMIGDAVASKTVSLRSKVNAIDSNMDNMELRMIRLEEKIDKIMELVLKDQPQH